MGEHQAIDPDPKELTRANETWEAFTKISKYSIYAVIASLVILALVFVDW